MSADLDDLLARADAVRSRLRTRSDLPPDPWERLRRAHAELMAMDLDDDEPGCASRPELVLIRGGRDG